MQEADTGRSDRASSADGIEGDTRKGANTPDAFDTSEDCLSESECRVEREPHIREKGLS